MKIHQSVHCCRFTFNVSPQIDTFISRMDWIQESRTGLMDITSRYSMDKNMEVSTGDPQSSPWLSIPAGHPMHHRTRAKPLHSCCCAKLSFTFPGGSSSMGSMAFFAPHDLSTFHTHTLLVQPVTNMCLNMFAATPRFARGQSRISYEMLKSMRRVQVFAF